MTIFHVYAYVGPRRPNGFPRHRWRGRRDEIIGVNAEWTLQRIHKKIVRLTHRVPMTQVKDFPEAMDC